jgi:dTDP-4-amino-4,6-dideoxygalactose transaminase
MTTKMKIPFLDLITPHVELEEELVGIFRNTLRTAGFIGGPVVEQFERNFARFCHVEHCVGLGSGTDAVRFALMAAGVKAGESVITVPNTFIATTEAISQAGALPEFVDIDERTYNMNPEKLRDYLASNCDTDEGSGRPISRRTGRIISAVIPVHLYGQPADMEPILAVANAHNLIVVEDACQAHGAEWFSSKDQMWRKVGSIGRVAAFSFYPGKNLGACGEAGAVTTNDPDLAQKIRMLRDHGQAEKYYHDVEGYNGRLDALQAGLLDAKLRHLEKWNMLRRERAAEYTNMLSAHEAVTIPYEPSWSRGVWHLYVIRTDDRQGLMDYLKGVGVGVGIHYPVPLHLQKAYRSLKYVEGDFPVAERMSAEIVSLPMSPQLILDQQKEVVKEILAFASNLATVEVMQ